MARKSKARIGDGSFARLAAFTDSLATRDPAPVHAKDADCTIDPATECCTVCGVDHGGECAACHGRGFHADGCAEARS